MFYGASAFNVNIGGWNVAGLTSLSSVFYNSKAFNLDVSSWNTARVATLRPLTYAVKHAEP